MNPDLSARTGARLVSADRVQGTAVFNRDGERLGTIDKVFIDKVSGQAEFASMAFGGVLGVGAKHHPLPWTVLVYDPAQEGFVVDLDKKILDESPSYDDDRLSGSDVSWAQEVRGHFGIA
jgi:hypothetical protein